MKVPILIFLALCIAHGNSQGFFGSIAKGALKAIGGVDNMNPTNIPVCNKNMYQDFKQSQKAIYSNLYQRVASQNDNHFVFSPYTIWLTLSALAEGADPSVQAKLFTDLLLPQEACQRKKIYEMALNVEQTGHDVTFLRNRQLVLDQSLVVNPSWENLTRTMGLRVTVAPIMTDPEGTLQQLRETMPASSDIVLSGNSILLDSLEYQGLWTTAFPAESVRPEPFYDDAGQQIGVVNMMRMKKRVRMAHLPFIKAKALELPVGVDGRYKMLITIGLGHDDIKNAIEFFMATILKIFSLLKTSLVPIEIAVPQLAMTSKFDVRTILEGDSLDAFFKDPASTSLVSHPPALLSSLIQRVSINIGPDGVNPLPEREVFDPISGLLNMVSNTATGIATAVGRDFIANKPFLFGLFDTKTETCLFAGAYSRPT